MQVFRKNGKILAEIYVSLRNKQVRQQLLIANQVGLYVKEEIENVVPISQNLFAYLSDMTCTEHRLGNKEHAAMISNGMLNAVSQINVVRWFGTTGLP